MSRQDVTPQARALYAGGATIAQVADALGVSPTTVSRWKARDQAAGVSWEQRRAERRRKDPHALLNILEARREELAERDPKEDYGAYADALHKLQRVIASVRAEFKDVSTALGVLEDFAGFCGDGLPAQDLAVVRRATESYLDHLKRETAA